MLKTNKNHEEGKFNKKGKEILIKIGATVVAVSMFSGILTYNIQSFTNREEIVSVSSNVRRSIYHHNDYLDGKTVYSGSSTDYFDEYARKDLYITEETLNNMKYLTIDMAENRDLSFLDYCKNLEEVYISHAELLTESDIALLENCNVYDIKLEIGLKEYMKNRSLPSYLSKFFSQKKLTLKIDAMLFSNELAEYIVYDLSKSISSNIKVEMASGPAIDYEKCESIDIKLNELIKTINLSSINKEEDIFYEIYGMVANFISYDNDVAFNNENAEDKINYYNDYLLSSILFSNNAKENEGICCNYAALFTALAYKCGLEVYYITGKCYDYSHTWNLVKVDGNYKYIDITNLDLSYALDRFGEEYVDEKYRKSAVLKPEGLEYYDPASRYKNVENKSVKNDMDYYNVEFAGDFVNLEPDNTLPTIISLGSGGVVAIICTLRRKKNKTDEETIKR